MSNVLDGLSVLILLTSFVLMAGKRAKSYIRTFRLQSILIAAATGVMGVKSFIESGRIDVLVVCLLIIMLKVIFIPKHLRRTQATAEYTVGKDYFLKIPTLVLISFGLVIFTYFSISTIDGLNEGTMSIQLVDAISVILIGVFFMISRKNAIGQIIGFLVIENGIFTTALYATEGMPLVVDIGIFVDLITAVMILAIMVFRISEKFESIDIKKLNNLKG